MFKTNTELFAPRMQRMLGFGNVVVVAKQHGFDHLAMLPNTGDVALHPQSGPFQPTDLWQECSRVAVYFFVPGEKVM